MKVNLCRMGDAIGFSNLVEPSTLFKEEDDFYIEHSGAKVAIKFDGYCYGVPPAAQVKAYKLIVERVEQLVPGRDLIGKIHSILQATNLAAGIFLERGQLALVRLPPQASGLLEKFDPQLHYVVHEVVAPLVHTATESAFRKAFAPNGARITPKVARELWGEGKP